MCAQSDQHLCYLLIVKGISRSAIQAIFQFSSCICSLSSSAGWFECYFVGNPEDRFSCVEAHMILAQVLKFMSMRYCKLRIFRKESTAATQNIGLNDKWKLKEGR